MKGNKTKIPQNEIMENGKIPVVSQNRNGIIEGYTDYEEVITDLPLIVLGIIVVLLNILIFHLFEEQMVHN